MPRTEVEYIYTLINEIDNDKRQKHFARSERIFIHVAWTFVEIFIIHRITPLQASDNSHLYCIAMKHSYVRSVKTLNANNKVLFIIEM